MKFRCQREIRLNDVGYLNNERQQAKKKKNSKIQIKTQFSLFVAFNCCDQKGMSFYSLIVESQIFRRNQFWLCRRWKIPQTLMSSFVMRNNLFHLKVKISGQSHWQLNIIRNHSQMSQVEYFWFLWKLFCNQKVDLQNKSCSHTSTVKWQKNLTYTHIHKWLFLLTHLFSFHSFTFCVCILFWFCFAFVFSASM